VDTATQTTTAESVSFEIERHVQQLERIADPAVRSAAMDLVSSVLQLHAEALGNMLRILADSSADSKAVLAAFERDALVRSVLLLHGLHSQPVEARIHRALTDLEPALQKYGAAVEIARADADAVFITIQLGGQGCGSTADTVRSLVERRISEAAPDVPEVVIDLPPVAPGSFIPIQAIQPAAPSQCAAGTQEKQ
jgi:Fe-S cluster biogenesis protein NfuA